MAVLHAYDRQLWLPAVSRRSCVREPRNRPVRKHRHRGWTQLCFAFYEALLKRKAALAARRCACGRRAAHRSHACERCNELDGGGVVQSEILHYLLGGAATDSEIAQECGVSRRVAWDVLNKLQRKGRVTRVQTDEGSYYRLGRR